MFGWGSVWTELHWLFATKNTLLSSSLSAHWQTRTSFGQNCQAVTGLPFPPSCCLWRSQ